MSVTTRRQPDLKMGQTVHFGNHTLTADVSVVEGGEGAGPSPHDLYDAALGACKALTVMWYATRKTLPVDDIEVVVDRDATQERAGTYGLSATLRIGGLVSDAQLDELLKVAEKCPVHKLMTTVTTVITTQIERMT
ncbi:MAG: OsmC family protein [Steroidobacteraceae bacterium]